jgi:hypothetical protein
VLGEQEKAARGPTGGNNDADIALAIVIDHRGAFKAEVVEVWGAGAVQGQVIAVVPSTTQIVDAALA